MIKSQVIAFLRHTVWYTKTKFAS